MPTVPTYDALRVDQSPQQRSGYASDGVPDIAAQQTRQLGQGLLRFGQAASGIALDALQQANQVRVTDAMNKAVQAKLRLTYDRAEGFVNLKGDAALSRPGGKGLDEEYVSKLDEQLEAIHEQLGNEEQRSAFAQQSAQLREQFRGALSQHMAREFGDYQVGVQDGRIKTASNQMALAFDDAQAIGQSVNAIKAAVAERGRLRGASPLEIESDMVESLSPAHAAVVAGAVDAGKLGYASEYLKHASAELTPQTRLRLQGLLDTGVVEKRTQELAGALYAKHRGNTAAALAEARTTLEGKDEDGVVARLKTLDSERVTFRERAQRDAADTAWKIYATGGGIGKIPPSVLNAMDGRDIEALRKTAIADAEAAAAQKEVKTNPEVYYALTIAAATDPNFTKEDLRRFFDVLSPAHRAHFADLQAKLLKPQERDEVVSVQQQKASAARAMGLKEEEAGVFFQEADRALFAQQKAKGRALDQDERQNVLDRLAIQGETPGRFWGTSSLRAFEAQAQGRTFTPEWSDTQRRKAIAALQRLGVAAPSEQQIDMTLRRTYGIQEERPVRRIGATVNY